MVAEATWYMVHMDLVLRLDKRGDHTFATRSTIRPMDPFAERWGADPWNIPASATRTVTTFALAENCAVSFVGGLAGSAAEA